MPSGVQDLICIGVHLLAEVLVEDKSQYIITEVISAHLAPEGVGDVPELLFEFQFFGHESALKKSVFNQ
jgi:hypothetical protein